MMESCNSNGLHPSPCEFSLCIGGCVWLSRCVCVCMRVCMCMYVLGCTVDVCMCARMYVAILHVD